MIEVTFDITEDGICYGFQGCGHAGYAPRGSDIVCAAVSVLAQGAASSLEQLKDPGARTEQRAGNLVCTIAAPDIASQAILFMVKNSLKQLEEQYGNYVKVCHG